MARKYELSGSVGLGKALWIPDSSIVEFFYYDCPYYFNTSLPYHSFFRYMEGIGGDGYPSSDRLCYLPDPTNTSYKDLVIQIRYSGKRLFYQHPLKVHCGNSDNPRIYVGGTLGTFPNRGFLHTIALKSGGTLEFVCKNNYWELFEWYQAPST